MLAFSETERQCRDETIARRVNRGLEQFPYLPDDGLVDVHVVCALLGRSAASIGVTWRMAFSRLPFAWACVPLDGAPATFALLCVGEMVQSKDRSRPGRCERARLPHLYAVPRVERVCGPRDGLEQSVKAAIRASLLRHPAQEHSKLQIAFHEVGHFVAFEVEGMIAFDMHIKGSPFGHGGWQGQARCVNWPDIRPDQPDALEFLRDARTCLAGPWAEAAFGNADVLGCSPIEMLETHVLVAKAAQLLGQDFHDVLAVRLHAQALWWRRMRKLLKILRSD